MDNYRLIARIACLAVLWPFVMPATAAVLSVGQTGATCEASTIEAAIAVATQLGGQNEIRVTRDVAGGAWN